jgi:hypothetical protein
MAIRITKKTRKNRKTTKTDCYNYAKKGTQLNSKSCTSKMYKSVYGSVTGGGARKTRALYL